MWRTKGVDDFRLLVLEALGEDRFKWKPNGPLAVVICLESKLWVTQTRQVRQMDADNKVKVVLDSIENATGIPDELYWHLHVFKLSSKRNRTTVHVFDLGDIVEFYG
jgi:Holliday junction resolvase RusA-like endonuclease